MMPERSEILVFAFWVLDTRTSFMGYRSGDRILLSQISQVFASQMYHLKPN